MVARALPPPWTPGAAAALLLLALLLVLLALLAVRPDVGAKSSPSASLSARVFLVATDAAGADEAMGGVCAASPNVLSSGSQASGGSA